VLEGVLAKMRILIRTLLKEYKYPLDQQKDSVDRALRQAEVISEETAAT
jgi:hypothetical protein